MKDIGVIGCGTIGKAICQAVASGQTGGRLAAVADKTPEIAAAAMREAGIDVPAYTVEELMDRCDLVVEAASKAAAGPILDMALARGRDTMLLSAGALLDEYETLREKARAAGCVIYVPSGALAGLDGVKGALSGEISSVTLTTTKPPKGLQGIAYLEQRGIDVMALTEAAEVFSGTAREAVPLFPANINVAAALSMAGTGPDTTFVRIIADPACTRNTHEVRVEGSFGVLTTRAENLPAAFNPKTSAMAAYSAIALLRSITSSLRIGS
ncbi:aspartate dehydrogenase [Desulfovibrio sp. OttesenSCG-928-I05]|nr:aspartate dehydrogenase [Desulfovibrio sp. OttesenSCG-928-I05]